MKLYYNNNLALFIPSSILYLNNDNVILKLNKKITNNDKNKLYNLIDINDIQLKLKYKNYNYDEKNLIVIKDYIYKFHIVKDNHEDKTYHLYKHKISSIHSFSKMLNSCWFINNL